MAFIVEDGTGIDNANSYVSLDYADTYHEDRGNVVWSDSTTGYEDSAKESALINATDYLDNHFKFKGSHYNTSTTDPQPNNLQWPRYGCYDKQGSSILTTTIPKQVKDAICELALKDAAGTELLSDTERLAKSEKVGPISITYVDNTASQTTFSLVEDILRSLISSSSGYFVNKRL